MRLGFRELLDRYGNEVVMGRGTVTLETIAGVRPDVVLVDLESIESSDLAGGVADRFPEVTLVACSSTRPIMRVYPAHNGGASYDADLTPELLVEAIATG